MSVRKLLYALLVLFLAHPVLAEKDEHEGGIIGTGIVGTITQLGSIYVNGQHILIKDDLPISGAITPMIAADLQPGHVVAVTVHPDSADWRANSIRQVFSLVGPVEMISDRAITVLGTHVELGTLSPTLKSGDWVAVSGLWQGRSVVASRIDNVPSSHQKARISGTYFGPKADGRNLIGSTTIVGINTRHLMPGDLVRVFGHPIPGGIDATRLERNLFEKTVSIVQIEGYLSQPRPSGLYTVLGSGLVAYTGRPEMIDPKTRIVACGKNGQLEVPTQGNTKLQEVLDRLDCQT